MVRDWHLEQLCRLRYFKEEGARLRRLERNAARSGKAFSVPTHRASTNIAGVCGGGDDGRPAALDLTANGDLAISSSPSHTVHPHVPDQSQEMLPAAGKSAVAEVSVTSHPVAGERLHAVCAMHAGGPRRDVLDRRADAKLIDGPSDFATLRLSGIDGSDSTGSLSVSDLQGLPAHPSCLVPSFAMCKEQLSTVRKQPSSGESLGVACKGQTTFMWDEECLEAGDRGAEEDHSNLPAQKLAAFVEHEVLSTKIDTLQGMRQKTVDTILGMKEMVRQGATANAMRVCKCEHVLADALMCLQEYSEEQGSLAEQVATLRLSARKLVSSSQSRLAQAALNDQDDFGVHVTGGEAPGRCEGQAAQDMELEEMLKKMQSHVHDLDRDRQDLSERVTALTLSLSTAESDAAGLQRDLDGSSKDLERCKAELETCRLERISLLNSTGEQVSKLEAQNHDLADIADGLSRRLSACQAQLDTELEDGIVKATQIETIKTQLATVQDEVHELRRDKQTLEDRLSAVRSQEDTTVTKLTQDLESAMSIAEEVCKAGTNLWHAQLAANGKHGILKGELADVAWKHRVEMEEKEKEGRHRDLAIAALQEEVGVLKGKVVEAEQAQAEADEMAERRRKEAIAVCAREEGLREELSQARDREGALIERQLEREAEVKMLLTEEARRQETLSKMQGECNDQLQRQLQTNADLSVQVQEGRRELEAMRQKTMDTILGMKEMVRQGATANAMRVCKCEHVLADVFREYQSQLAATEQRKSDCSQDEGFVLGKAQGRAQPGDDSSCTQAAHGLVQQARRPDPSTPVPSPGIRAGGSVCFFSPRARADTEQLRRRFEAAINEANHSRNYSFGDG